MLKKLLRDTTWLLVSSIAIVFVTTAAAVVPTARAQTDLPPEKGGMTRSMGIPTLFKPFTGFEMQWDRPGDTNEMALYADLGVYRYLGHPVVGLAGLQVEAYGGARARELDGGGRAYFMIPSLLIAGGVDYNLTEESLDFILRLELPIRRGGIIGIGSSLTMRWIPSRHHTFGAGLTIPFGDRDIGKTRPKRDYVRLDKRKPQRLESDETEPFLVEALEIMRERSHWIARLSQPFTEESGSDAHKAMEKVLAELEPHLATVDPLFPQGHTLPEEIRVFHEALDRSFSMAISGEPIAAGSGTSQGRRLSAAARGYLFDDVLVPYNYLLGQLKKDHSLTGMIAVAQTEYARWLLSEAGLEREQAVRAFYVFQTLCDAVEANREELQERWEDSRLVWLPLHYAFKPEEHDTQKELNDIIGRAARSEFTSGNRIWYIINEEFQYEMARSVLLAEDYHVLWIHDVAGYNHGEPDELAYEQVKNYLTAMVQRVRAYDETGKFPMYLIFLDQFYYESNKGRHWMTLLQDPLDHVLKLPSDFEAWEQEIAALQEDLRQAVEESELLRVERSQYGEKWLKNRIKVHVNITNPADPSYMSWKVIGIMPIPDNNMRDHRKIVFYDVTEEDPYRGMTMYTGMGIGKHYVGSNWEDRAVMLKGPGALATKDAARFLLEVQGFAPEDIPYPLRPKPRGESYDAQIAEMLDGFAPRWLDDDYKVLELHNETGFTPKPINIAKSILYSLMPPGSVLKVPDSLWQSHVYASLMAGSALRGCRVLIVAPSLRSAPSSGGWQMARAHGLMGRLVVLRNGLQDAIDAQGGVLQVGIYAPRQGVGDIAGRLQQAVDVSGDWVRKVYIDNPALDRVAVNAQAQLDSLGYSAEYLAEADALESPKLHLKANFFASKSAWDRILGHPDLAGVLREYIPYLAQQHIPSDGDPDVQKIPDELRAKWKNLIRGLVRDMTPQEVEEMILYLTVGSVNMDYRSMAMNAEVMLTIAGFSSVAGMIDFVLLAGLCEWIETTEQLDELLPPPGGFTRRMASLIKLGL